MDVEDRGRAECELFGRAPLHCDECARTRTRTRTRTSHWREEEEETPGVRRAISKGVMGWTMAAFLLVISLNLRRSQNKPVLGETKEWQGGRGGGGGGEGGGGDREAFNRRLEEEVREGQASLKALR